MAPEPMLSWRESCQGRSTNCFPLSHRPSGWKDRQATRLALEGQRIYNYRLQSPPQTPESELGRRKGRNEEMSAWVLRAARQSGEASGNNDIGKAQLGGAGASRVVSGQFLCLRPTCMS